MTESEAAKFLGLSLYQLQLRRKRGDVPHRKLGRTIAYRRTDLTVWLAKGGK